MQDRELYRQILGIEAPWVVERVELKLAEGKVHVYLEHKEMASWARAAKRVAVTVLPPVRLSDEPNDEEWKPFSINGTLPPVSGLSLALIGNASGQKTVATDGKLDPRHFR